MSIAKRFQDSLDHEGDGPDRRYSGVLCVEHGHGRCVWLFNDEGFEREMEAFETRALDGGSREDQRDFFEYTAPFTLDASGRLCIPAEFRELTGIDTEAVAVGLNSRVEIWARDRWENRHRGPASPVTPPVNDTASGAGEGERA